MARNCDQIRQKHEFVCSSGADPLRVFVGLYLMTTAPSVLLLYFLYIQPEHHPLNPLIYYFVDTYNMRPGLPSIWRYQSRISMYK